MIFLAMDNVLAGGSIVPIHFVSGNVVGADSAWLRNRLRLGNGKRTPQREREQQRQIAQNPSPNEKVEQSYARWEGVSIERHDRGADGLTA